MYSSMGALFDITTTAGGFGQTRCITILDVMSNPAAATFITIITIFTIITTVTISTVIPIISRNLTGTMQVAVVHLLVKYFCKQPGHNARMGILLEKDSRLKLLQAKMPIISEIG